MTDTLDYAKPETPQHQSLADAMNEVRDQSAGQPMTVRQIVDVLKDRGIVVVLIILTMPFLFPVPTMGLSAPAGAAIAIYGFCVAIGKQPWLPNFLLKRELSAKAIDKLVGFGQRWAKRVEKLVRPRLAVMNWAGINILTGLCLILDGIFMSLPLPIPATNAIPALGILLLLIGQLERDGVFVIAGQIVSAIITVLFVGAGVLVLKYGWEGAKAVIGL